ncbi:MAG: hypothetical protein HQM09_00930 [Candidatus Riflebacteria bacterium]|nr:hypothetical protein [Candidatus Riflebacteria bacterium]
MSELVIALDTSGSMSPEVLSHALNMISQLSELADSCLVLVGDAKIQQVIPTCRIASFVQRLQVKGGGGTDHRPIFHWLENHQKRPALFVGITDLASSFPENKPAFPVIWLTPKNHARAPWGTVIEVCS